MNHRLILLSLTLAPFLGFSQCNQLRKETDKFNGKITLYTNLLEPVMVQKTYDGDAVNYYLRLSAPGEPSTDHKGVTMLLAGGLRLDWPEQLVKTEVTSYHPRWSSVVTASSFISLTDDQVQRMAKTLITDYRLYVYDYTMPGKLAKPFMEQMGCLLRATPASVKEK